MSKVTNLEFNKICRTHIGSLFIIPNLRSCQVLESCVKMFFGSENFEKGSWRELPFSFVRSGPMQIALFYNKLMFCPEGFCGTLIKVPIYINYTKGSK